MNPLYRFFCLLLFVSTVYVSLIATCFALPSGKNPFILYPPLNFMGTAIECYGYLQWQKPEMPNGTTPAGLVGYYLYRDGALRHYIPSGDSLSFYDYYLEYGTYNYTITANYDLSFYGVPGQFGESPAAGPAAVNINCSFGMPFFEPWDAGTFAFQSWQFVPAQANWTMNTGAGNPAPAAFFNGMPVLSAYEATMKSISLPFGPWVCANIYLEFDYKLTDIAGNGTEKLIAGYYLSNSWYPVTEISNTGSTDWIHQKFDISQVSGKTCRVGFRASGISSTNIGSWAVDNIKVSPVCKGPASCDWTRSANMVHLFWQPPSCDSVQVVQGYNVYRTQGTTGEPPFVKLNTAPVASLEYNDMIPPAIYNAIFRYMITALHHNTATNELLCEAPCDTLIVDYVLGIRKHDREGLQIVMNPVLHCIDIQSETAIEFCELYNCMGQQILSVPTGKSLKMNIPIASQHAGIYFVRIKNASQTLVKKVSVMQ